MGMRTNSTECLHTHTHTHTAMRYYYTDFLLLPEFQPPFEDTNPVLDLEEVIIYIEKSKPRTRLDVYPLYILLKVIHVHKYIYIYMCMYTCIHMY